MFVPSNCDNDNFFHLKWKKKDDPIRSGTSNLTVPCTNFRCVLTFVYTEKKERKKEGKPVNDELFTWRQCNVSIVFSVRALVHVRDL